MTILLAWIECAYDKDMAGVYFGVVVLDFVAILALMEILK